MALVPVSAYGINDAALAQLSGPGLDILDYLYDTPLAVRSGIEFVVAIRFRATESSAFSSIKNYWSASSTPGANTYSGGNGGVLPIAIYPDDGSAAHLPNLTGSPLASLTYRPASNGMSNGVYPGNAQGFFDNAFAAGAATAVKGQIYHAFFRNTAGSPTTDWSTLDMAAVMSQNGKPHRYLDATDWGILVGTRAAGSTGAYTWTDRSKTLYNNTLWSPICQISYSNGKKQGFAGAIESGNRGPISGNPALYAITGNEYVQEVCTVAAGTLGGISVFTAASTAGRLTIQVEQNGQVLRERFIDRATANYSTNGAQGVFTWEDRDFDAIAIQAGTLIVRYIPTSGTWVFAGQRNGSGKAFVPPTVPMSYGQHFDGTTLRDQYFWDHTVTGTKDGNWKMVLHWNAESTTPPSTDPQPYVANSTLWPASVRARVAQITSGTWSAASQQALSEYLRELAGTQGVYCDFIQSGAIKGTLTFPGTLSIVGGQISLSTTPSGISGLAALTRAQPATFRIRAVNGSFRMSVALAAADTAAILTGDLTPSVAIAILGIKIGQAGTTTQPPVDPNPPVGNVPFATRLLMFGTSLTEGANPENGVNEFLYVGPRGPAYVAMRTGGALVSMLGNRTNPVRNNLEPTGISGGQNGARIAQIMANMDAVRAQNPGADGTGWYITIELGANDKDQPGMTVATMYSLVKQAYDKAIGYWPKAVFGLMGMTPNLYGGSWQPYQDAINALTATYDTGGMIIDVKAQDIAFSTQAGVDYTTFDGGLHRTQSGATKLGNAIAAKYFERIARLNGTTTPTNPNPNPNPNPTNRPSITLEALIATQKNASVIQPRGGTHINSQACIRSPNYDALAAFCPVGGAQGFVQNFNEVLPWLWLYNGPNHTLGRGYRINYRRAIISILSKSTGQWYDFPMTENAFDGYVWEHNRQEPGRLNSGTGWERRESDGTKSSDWPGNWGAELWPAPAVDRARMVDGKAVAVIAECRVIDAQGRPYYGTDAEYAFQLGYDQYARPRGGSFKQSNGYPGFQMDGGNGRWNRITGGDWQPVAMITMASFKRNENPFNGYQPPWPYSDAPYCLSEAELRNGPLPSWVTR